MGTVPSISSFSAGAILTAAQLNAIKDAYDFLKQPPHCTVYSAAGANLGTSGADTLMTGWDSELFDVVQSGDTPMHSTVTNPERIFARTTGVYEITGSINFAANATGYRQAMIRFNSAGSASGGSALAVMTTAPVNGTNTTLPIPAIRRAFSAGDYIEVFLRQTSGGALAVGSGSGATWLSMRWANA